MPSPTSSSGITTLTLSGTQTIDALLFGARWASSNLTYSFPQYTSSWSTDEFSGYGSSGGSGEPWSPSFKPLSAAGFGDDQTLFANALRKWSNVANLAFTEVADTATNVGDIRAAYTYPSDHPNSTVAWAYLPSESPVAGDIWFSTLNVSASDRWTPGSFAFLAVMHELGHALGLKHPFETTGDVSAVLPTTYDSQTYTIMSYSALAGNTTTSYSFSPTTPMTLDIVAIQHLYGANTTYHAANDTYAYSDSTTYHETIWDAGGTDTLQYTGRFSSIIDLRAGNGSKIGTPVFIESSSGANLQQVSNVWIAFGVTVENAAGGSGNDVITGNDARNSLAGNGGNDVIDGGAGIDTVVLSGSVSDYARAFKRPDGTFTTTDRRVSGDGSDTLKNVERLSFGSKKFAIDLLPNQHAGLALEFIGMVDPGLISNPSVVGTILNILDQGSSLHDVCQLALDVGLINTVAGSNTNQALAAMAYRNIIGTEADAATVDGLVGYMDGRSASYSQADFMAVAAGLEVNQIHIGLLGIQQTGIEFA